MIKKMKNSTTNTSIKSENNKKTTDIVIYTEETIFRKRYIKIDKSFLSKDENDYTENIHNLITYCLENQLLNEDEQVLDYEIEQP